MDGLRFAGPVLALTVATNPMYTDSMSPVAKEILQKVAGWPDEDQEELAELAREIEARRTGVYVLSDDEQAAIADARRGAFVSEEDARAFWQRHGLA